MYDRNLTVQDESAREQRFLRLLLFFTQHEPNLSRFIRHSLTVVNDLKQVGLLSMKTKHTPTCSNIMNKSWPFHLLQRIDHSLIMYQ